MALLRGLRVGGGGVAGAARERSAVAARRLLRRGTRETQPKQA